MEFSHPLARGAKVWIARSHDGSELPMLVIVTTVELDPWKASDIIKISLSVFRAAQEYLADLTLASGFILVNRFRSWSSHRT